MNHWILFLCLQCLLLLFSVQGRLGLAPRGVSTIHLNSESVVVKSHAKFTSTEGVIAKMVTLRGGVERFQPQKVILISINAH